MFQNGKAESDHLAKMLLAAIYKLDLNLSCLSHGLLPGAFISDAVQWS